MRDEEMRVSCPAEAWQYDKYDPDNGVFLLLGGWVAGSYTVFGRIVGQAGPSERYG